MSNPYFWLGWAIACRRGMSIGVVVTSVLAVMQPHNHVWLALGAEELLGLLFFTHAAAKLRDELDSNH